MPLSEHTSTSPVQRADSSIVEVPNLGPSNQRNSQPLYLARGRFAFTPRGADLPLDDEGKHSPEHDIGGLEWDAVVWRDDEAVQVRFLVRSAECRKVQ